MTLKNDSPIKWIPRRFAVTIPFIEFGQGFFKKRFFNTDFTSENDRKLD